MPESPMDTRMIFETRVREALAAALGASGPDGERPTLTAEDRRVLCLYARLLRWPGPLRLLEMHEAAARVAQGDARAFEALAQLGQWCWNHSDAPENAPIRDALKAAVLDRPAMAATETLAASMPQAHRPVPAPRTGRVAFVVSSLVAGAGTTFVMRALAPDLSALGWQVVIHPTAADGGGDAPTFDALQQAGVQVQPPPAGADHMNRAAWLADRLLDQSVDAVVHYVWPHDYVAKLLSNLRCAPLQVFVNHTCDQPTGDFDLKIGYSRNYRGHHQAERYVTLPNCSVRASQARRIAPLDRSRLGLPPEALCLATFSRLAKCVDAPFLDAMGRILRNNPRALWLLVGARDPACEGQINAALGRAGVADRVVYTGFLQGDDYFRLLKAVDLYCDTITWMGGQTVADAVACGLPVVCCAGGDRTSLAPHGNNPTVLASELLAPGARVARAADALDYARLAQAYIDDPALREQAGRANRDSVDDDAWPAYVRRFDFLLRHALRYKQAAGVPERPAVAVA